MTTNSEQLQRELNSRGLAHNIPVYRYNPETDRFERLIDIRRTDPDSEPCSPERLPWNSAIYRISWDYGLDYVRTLDYPLMRAQNPNAYHWRRANAV